MPTFNASETDRLLYRMAVVVRRLRLQVDAQLGAYGLTQATWRPLAYLAFVQDGPTQCELAGALQVGSPALVRILDTLEAKGLLARVDCEDDRRVKRLVLKPAGKKLVTRVRAVVHHGDGDLLAGVPAGDLRACTRVLTSLESRLESLEVARDCSPAPARKARTSRTP